MRSSTARYIAVFAVVIIAAAAVVVYINPFGGDSDDGDSDARYFYNYKQEIVDSITLADGSTVTKEDGSADAIYVYTVAFRNDYTSSAYFYLFPYSSTSPSINNTVVLKTTITNPKTGEGSSDSSSDTLYLKDMAIRNFFTTSSSYYYAYAGTINVFQVAFFHKDHSDRATEDSKITVDLDINKTDISKYLERSDKIAVPDGAALQFKASPTLTTSTYTTSSEISLSDGSTAKADPGYCYRVYKIGMRSMGSACTIDPSAVHLILEYKDATSTVTAGKTFDAITNYINTAPVSLEAWSDNENTPCQTIEVAFMVPLKDSSVASTVNTTAYLLIDGHPAGFTNNSHVVVG